MNRNSDFRSACKVSKDRFIREAMMHDDVDLASRAQYAAIQMIKNPEIEGHGQHKVRFLKAENHSGMSIST